MSHWWGEPVFDFVSCIEQHTKDRIRPDETDEKKKKPLNYWVCANANNQWKLDEELVDDLAKTSFRKALDKADGTVTVLDVEGKTFTRVWCCYEIFVSLAVYDGRLKYDVYTAKAHAPVIRAG